MQTKGSFSEPTQMSPHVKLWAVGYSLLMIAALILAALGEAIVGFYLFLSAAVWFVIGLALLYIRRRPIRPTQSK